MLLAELIHLSTTFGALWILMLALAGLSAAFVFEKLSTSYQRWIAWLGSGLLVAGVLAFLVFGAEGIVAPSTVESEVVRQCIDLDNIEGEPSATECRSGVKVLYPDSKYFEGR